MTSSTCKLRILIAAKERNVRDQVRQYLQASGKVEVVGTAIDGQEAVQLCVLLRPDSAFIKSDLPILDGFEASDMIGLAAPEVSRVILGDGPADPKTWQKAMLSGVRAYVCCPVQEAEVNEVLASLISIVDKQDIPEYRTATDPSQLPKVIAVTGGKGGIGKTTIATLLGMCLSEKHPGRVVLCDFYTQFGDVATVLDVTPKTQLCDLIQTVDSVDLDAIEGCMIEPFSGLKLLISTTKSRPIDAISVADAESIINNLKRAYTHIVIDLPPILHSTTLYVLSQCYNALIVTNLFDVPTVHDTKELYDAVVGTYVPEDRVLLVANRTSKFDRLSITAMEKLFGRKVDVTIPNDRRLVSSTNQGVPFVKAYAHSPLVSAVQKMIQNIDRTDVAQDKQSQ